MTKRKGFRGLVQRLLMLPVLFALVFSFAAAPTRAAQEDLEELLAQLALLQSQDIDPTWTPDIEANQATVAAMLAAYQRTTDADRAKLTETQNEDLMAYFEALYLVQGRDPIDVGSLFGDSNTTPNAGKDILGEGGSSSSSSASSSSASSSSASSSSSQSRANAAADTSQSSSASSSSEDSSEESSSAAATTTTDTSGDTSGLIDVHFTPQMPQANGLFAILSSNVLSSFLMLVMVLLLAAIFVRFLAALRAEARERQELAALFGPGAEDTAPPPTTTMFPLSHEDIEVDPAPKKRRKRRLPRKERRAESHWAESGVSDDQLWRTTPEEEKIFETSFTDIPKKETSAPRQQSNPLQPPAGINPAAGTPGTRVTDLPPDSTPKVRTVPTQSSRQSPKKPPPKKNIRTGRPGKMPFRVGTEDDLDGIDD